MSDTARDYTIEARFLDGTWQQEDTLLSGHFYLEAANLTIAVAKELDAKYGDSQFWTVTLTGPNGDYFQLFHQRMHDGYLNY